MNNYRYYLNGMEITGTEKLKYYYHMQVELEIYENGQLIGYTDIEEKEDY